VALGPSYRAYRPAQERLAVAKEKSAPLKPIPIEQQHLQALARSNNLRLCPSYGWRF
jgi:hypothetical protein